MKIFVNNLQDVSMTEDKFDMDVRNVRLFHDDTFPSFYRRLDFSPDGKYQFQFELDRLILYFQFSKRKYMIDDNGRG